MTSTRTEPPHSVWACVQVVLPGQSDAAGAETAAAATLELCTRHEYPQSPLALSQYWKSFQTAAWPPDPRFPVHPLAVLCWQPMVSGGTSKEGSEHLQSLQVQCCALWRRQGQEAELDYIVSAREARGSGLAEVTFQAAASALWGLGVETVSLEVSAQNAAALRFYTRLGFRAVRVRKGYYQQNGTAEDAVVMVKDLHFP